MPLCSIEGCTREQSTRGWCMTHYGRWYRHGDPLTQPATTESRYWAMVERRSADECWPWTARLNNSGYGEISVSGRAVKAHRFGYETQVGPIPPGLVIDHLCRNRKCQNASHMEPVTAEENNRRAVRESKTHCPQGHPYAGENLAIYGREKVCRTCRRDRLAAYRARNRKPLRPHHQAAKTHCPRGHEYAGANVYSNPNKPNRACRSCNRDRARERRAAAR